MKRIIAILLFSSLFSCSGGFVPTVNEADTSTTGTTTVKLPWNFFNLCGDFFEGEKNFTVVITVDIYENNEYQSNYFTKEYFINNTSNNYNFTFDDVEVPQNGSYIVSVTYNTDDCYTCCGQVNACDATDANGGIWPGGSPLYRGVKMMVNQSSTPTEININPTLMCF